MRWMRWKGKKRATEVKVESEVSRSLGEGKVDVELGVGDMDGMTMDVDEGRWQEGSGSINE